MRERERVGIEFMLVLFYRLSSGMSTRVILYKRFAIILSEGETPAYLFYP